MRGDLKTYQVHFQSPKGLGADLVLNREAPSVRAGGDDAWFIAIPFAKVQGTLTYGGQTHRVQGWVLDHWFWTTRHFGNYTLDAALQVTTSYYNHQQLQAFYLAKGEPDLNQRYEPLYCTWIRKPERSRWT